MNGRDRAFLNREKARERLKVFRIVEVHRVDVRLRQEQMNKCLARVKAPQHLLFDIVQRENVRRDLAGERRAQRQPYQRAVVERLRLREEVIEWRELILEHVDVVVLQIEDRDVGAFVVGHALVRIVVDDA